MNVGGSDDGDAAGCGAGSGRRRFHGVAGAVESRSGQPADARAGPGSREAARIYRGPGTGARLPAGADGQWHRQSVQRRTDPRGGVPGPRRRHVVDRRRHRRRTGGGAGSYRAAERPRRRRNHPGLQPPAGGGAAFGRRSGRSRAVQPRGTRIRQRHHGFARRQPADRRASGGAGPSLARLSVWAAGAVDRRRTLGTPVRERGAARVSISSASARSCRRSTKAPRPPMWDSAAVRPLWSRSTTCWRSESCSGCGGAMWTCLARSALWAMTTSSGPTSASRR